jgi:hypothetical protein
MVGPIVAGAVYSVLVIALSFLKPNAARIFLGIFFLATGLGVNLSFLLTQPSFVYDYGKNAWLPLYRQDNLPFNAKFRYGSYGNCEKPKT